MQLGKVVYYCLYIIKMDMTDLSKCGMYKDVIIHLLPFININSIPSKIPKLIKIDRAKNTITVIDTNVILINTKDLAKLIVKDSVIYTNKQNIKTIKKCIQSSINQKTLVYYKDKSKIVKYNFTTNNNK